VSGFNGRITQATEFEDQVRRRLLAANWQVERFGQALLTPTAREFLKRSRTNVRWLPDLIGAAGEIVVYFDAKASPPHPRTGCHAVETASCDAARQWQDFSGSMVFYAFPHHGDRITFVQLETWIAAKRPGKWLGNGSGTPFDIAHCSDVCGVVDQ